MLKRLQDSFRKVTVEARKLEHDRPSIPAPNHKKTKNQHKSSYFLVPTFGSLASGRFIVGEVCC